MNINVKEENVQFRLKEIEINFELIIGHCKKLGVSVNKEKKKMESVYIVIARYSQKNDLIISCQNNRYFHFCVR